MRHVDIAVSDPEQKLQLVVEIKSKSGASAEWVIHMRRNLLAHSLPPISCLCFLTFSTCGLTPTHLMIPPGPDYKIETTEVQASYLKSIQSLDDLSGYGLELLTISWLEDVVRNDLQRDSVNPNQMAF